MSFPNSHQQSNMKRTYRQWGAFAATALMIAAIAGCNGGAKFAPVSGVVSLNGKPYDKAIVVFQPMMTNDNPNPGRGSSAYTDANGRFTLKSDGTQDGAVIGRHTVRIMSRDNVVVKETTEPSPDDAPPPKLVDPIPAEWNEHSDKEFEVPPGGTDQANFDIVTKRK
jgi:hypothetical protein